MDELYVYTPKVNVAKELAEISKDFTSPKELVRETIANSIDATASRIIIEALKDDSSGEDELIVRIMDDGVGMTRQQLEGFFDLGYSNKPDPDNAIGHKGHGTKITYNSVMVKVFTKSIDGNSVLKAVLENPRKSLNLALKNAAEPPSVKIFEMRESGIQFLDEASSGTVIEVIGYDNNNWDAFAHAPLIDYIHWFTAWGRVDSVWGGGLGFSCTLSVLGIGEQEHAVVPYGHPFPDENYDFKALRAKDDRRPENFFVRRWISEPIKVQGFPDKEIRIAFSVEGDSAKREHNIMLKRVGRQKKPFPYESARYTVSERYGVYVCKDFIPIERKNERFADRSEWTKWHAFVNCQSFHLTANRASVENTPAGLLQAIYQTAEEYIKQFILESDEYEEFARKAQLEAGRRKAEREKKDVVRRYKAYKAKRRLKVSGNDKSMEFLEPRTEQGVVWLVARLTELWPEYFPQLNVIDLDSHFGYDLLVLRPQPLADSSSPAFVELKLNLRDSADFNHSFEFLSCIVCWETGLGSEEELIDIRGHKRVFKIARPNDDHSYTRCFLNDSEGGYNIEVIVLQKYLSEKLNLSPVL